MDAAQRVVYAVGLPKPEDPEGAAGKKKEGWKKWQPWLRDWAPESAGEALGLAGDALRRAVESGGFDASKGSTLWLPAGEQAWVLVVGLGEVDRVDTRVLQRAGAVSARTVIPLKDHGLVSLLHETPVKGIDEGDRLEATVQGIVLGAYKFDRFQGDGEAGSPAKGRKQTARKKDQQEPLQVSVLVSDARASRRLRPRVEAAQAAAQGQWVARDLANLPANVASPDHLAREARRLARETGLTCKVMGIPELKQRKMNGMLAVGQGSVNPPRLIVLRHTPQRNRARTFRRVVVVGKGITFDTGGISIKPSDRMELMKYDKSGACAVIALMAAVARAKLPVEVVGLAACAENMPSGSAYRPGDILTMAGGRKTVEVLNTDAEGRMVLADALDYAGSLNPDAVIDVATLTGAIDVALGSHYAGLMGTDDELIRLLEQAGESTGERVWRMPIGEEYQAQIKGSHSDLVNIGGRSGGALTAGQFLSNFVPEATAWAHLDIAGTAWDDKDRPENRKGASGFGVRLLYRFLSDLV